MGIVDKLFRNDDANSVNSTVPTHAQLLSTSAKDEHTLPPGTGPGTSGKPRTHPTIRNDSSKVSGSKKLQDSDGRSGVNTDGHGEGIVAYHARDQSSLSGKVAANELLSNSSVRGLSGVYDNHSETLSGASVGSFQADSDVRHGLPKGNLEGGYGEIQGDFSLPHDVGHNAADTRHVMPSGDVSENKHHLQHVTHEHVRHMETEEVLRQRELDRHVHHIQHHVQPILHREDGEEKHHENIHPVTRIREHHVNLEKDVAALDGLVGQHEDTISHAPKERTIIDRGVVENENVHHHVHHIIQPVIEKETIDRHRIHTVIPSHHEIHEAPIVHQSRTHEPISMEAFTSQIGSIDNGIPFDSVSNQFLHTGQCRREVDGIAEKLEQDLNLGHGNYNSMTHVSTSNANGPSLTIDGGRDVGGNLAQEEQYGRFAGLTGVGVNSSNAIDDRVAGRRRYDNDLIDDSSVQSANGDIATGRVGHHNGVGNNSMYDKGLKQAGSEVLDGHEVFDSVTPSRDGVGQRSLGKPAVATTDI